MKPRQLALAGSLWIAGALVYLLAEAVSASAFPGYSYATNYISDLGVPDVGTFQGRPIDSPLHALMNTAFVANGLLFLAASVIAVRVVARGPRRTLLALSIVFAAGIVMVGLVPGSPTNLANGLIALHGLGAAMAIIAGNLAALVGGVVARRNGLPRASAPVSTVLGVVGLIGLVLLLVDSGSTAIDLLPDGVWERIAVYAIIVWQLVTGVVLLRGRRAPTADA